MNFDRLAPHYDWMEAVLAGRLLQRARTSALHELGGCRNILSIGEGHGRFAQACLSAHPDARLTCVEASAGMIRKAQKRLGAMASRIRWQNCSFLEWESTGRFDALVCCFFLDCFPMRELSAVIDKASRCATPDARWLIADFGIPASGPRRWRARLIHWSMYRFFRTVVGLPARRLVSPDPMLQQRGFRLESRSEFEWGLLRADLWRRQAAP